MILIIQGVIIMAQDKNNKKNITIIERVRHITNSGRCRRNYRINGCRRDYARASDVVRKRPRPKNTTANNNNDKEE